MPVVTPVRSSATPIGSIPTFLRVLDAAARTVMTWGDRRQSRHALARLDDHLLRDIGLAPRMAAAEAARPFWRG